MATQARSIATVVGVRLAEAGQMLARHRHAALFDRLTTAGLLAEQYRTQLATDPAAPALAQLLRSVELAGHDPEQIVCDALAGRALDSARSVAQVLHHRIEQQHAGQLTPAGDRWADRLPGRVPPGWGRYVDRLGELADRRRAELGERVAAELPQWAVEAFGPPPVDEPARQRWQTRAGTVAAHRELVGHTDPAQPIGPAPARGSVEARGSWYAAWRALDRPEATAEETELSDGALQARVMARQREETWAPAWVGDDLAATAQALDRYRQAATLARAEARVTDDPQQHTAALRRAAEAAALVETLTVQQQRLELAAEVRGGWYAHTAETRAAAQRAAAELARRGVAFDLGPAEQAHAQSYLNDQPGGETDLPLVDADLVEDSTERQQRQAAVAAFDPPDPTTTTHPGDQDTAADGVDTGPVGLRPLPAGLPTTSATAAVVLRAHAALDRLADRHTAETLRLADEDTERALAQRASEAQEQEQTSAAGEVPDVALSRW